VCTLVAALHHFRGCPLVVAANRDEAYDRPASPVCVWPGERFVAPRDDAAGGTWLGLSASEVFVGVTNRFGVPKDATRESRGTLVVDRARTELVRAKVLALDPSRTPDAASIQAIMKIHGRVHPLGGTCVHVPERGYGTRSSMVLFVAERLEDSRMYWAEGSPCSSAYEDRSGMLADLADAAG
jgi:uncharacterized protein with NRDE domain